jgi:hypothetical protein
MMAQEMTDIAVKLNKTSWTMKLALAIACQAEVLAVTEI